MAANAAWGTKTGIDAANMMGDWLAANPQARLAGIDDFAKLFLTAKGEAKSARNLDKHEPAYADYQARVIAGITALRDRIALVNLAALLDPALTVGRRFALAWEAAKAREGFIDFDDQIRTAAALLTERTTADWIRYKLDRRFDHVWWTRRKTPTRRSGASCSTGWCRTSSRARGRASAIRAPCSWWATTSRRSSASRAPARKTLPRRASGCGANWRAWPRRWTSRSANCFRSAWGNPIAPPCRSWPLSIARLPRSARIALACPSARAACGRYAPRPGAAVAPGRRSFG
jgi:hypothetical protein